MTIYELNGRFPEGDFVVGDGGLTKLILTPDGFASQAEVYLLGAHVTGFTAPRRGQLLWMSDKAIFADGQAIRGGVPVCFPWFGPHPDNDTLPSHGLVRQRIWRVDSVSRKEDGTAVAVLAFESDEETLKLWPYLFKLEMKISVSSYLAVGLTVYNKGAEDFTVTEALHSYFSISDIRNIEISGLDGCEYIDKILLPTKRSIQRGTISFDGETDRVYLDTDATCAIVDPGNDRQVIIEKNGSASTVVWNPWIEKARKMPDYGNDEWPGMVCVETANALDNSVRVAAGESHTMGLAIKTADM